MKFIWTLDTIIALKDVTIEKCRRRFVQMGSSNIVRRLEDFIFEISSGLFQRIILMSQSAFNGNIVLRRSSARSAARELAQIAGCSYNSSLEIKKCFFKMEKSSILNAQQKLKLSAFDAYSAARIVYEDRKLPGAFLPEGTIRDGYPSTSIQWMIGHTTSEAGQDVAAFLSDGCPKCQMFNENYTKQLPVLYGYLSQSKPAYINFITNSIRSHYTGGQELSPDSDIIWTNMNSDLIYNFPVVSAIKSYNGTKFVYLYSYKSNFSTQLFKYSYKKYLGVCHVDDLQLLFMRNDSKDSLSSQDIIFGQEILTRWANFAHSGNPNEPYPINTSLFSYWEPVKTDRIEYLHMKLNGTMDTNFDYETYNFLSRFPLYMDFD